MALLKCAKIVGSQTIIEQDPAILTLPEVLYIPMGEPGAGIYDHGGRLVPPCFYWTGPGPAGDPPHNPLFTTLPYHEVNKRAPESLYVYGGLIAGHYGHFLLSTLCRYWAFDRPNFKGAKIIYHAYEDISSFFKKPYVADLFAAMHIDVGDFVRFKEPTRLTNITIPCPSFEESGFAHRAFARLGKQLGDAITSNATEAFSQVPVYLSKAKLSRGVRNLANEEEFADILSRYGVEVVYPEEMTLREQILLFRNRAIISGFRGSALHTSMFARECTIVGLAHCDDVQSNYTLIDRLTGTEAYYFYPENDIENLGANDAFSETVRLRDTRKTAEEFLRLIDMAARASPKKLHFRLTNIKTGKGYESPGRNIAVGRATRQSSLHLMAGNFSTATSGVLTGRYQFHTKDEPNPWWEVDMGQVVKFQMIRLHNRADNSQERASRFVILSSTDRENWSELHTQYNALKFGNGLEGLAFTWDCNSINVSFVAARFVLIILLATTYFHLDQVEVLTDVAPLDQHVN